jgi:hypothetical protein
MAMAAASAVPVGRLIGALKGFDPVMREIDVYHGSPHRFPPTENNPLGEFDASKIGTGEGAQAYGHGTYFAESPNVAQHYATGGGGFVPVQGKDNVYFNGQWVQDFSDKKSPEGLAKYAMSQSSTGTTIKEKTETLNKIGRKDAADWLEKNADKFNQSKGNLYTADLPDEMVDRMLDWDKPLSQQPKVLRALLNADDEWKAYVTQLSPKARKLAEDMAVGAKPSTGDEAYKLFKQLDADNPNADHNAIYDVIRKYNPRTTDQDWMMSMMSGSGAVGAGIRGGGGADLYNTLGGGAEAAQKLRAAGIPGMRYLDAGSRGQGGSGTRNFVVFPGEEKKVKILKRE